MTLYKNKYRIESARLKGYDYSSPGWYYITICTKKRVNYFGNIVETPNLGVSAVETPNLGVSMAKIQLSEIGIIADTYWNEIPIHNPHLKLDIYQIMPDHIHGIIQITDVPPKSKSRPTIGEIINQFKRICTLTTKYANIKFAWQPRFYDHIIRDDAELQRIRNYIRDNPQNWIIKKSIS